MRQMIHPPGAILGLMKAVVVEKPGKVVVKDIPTPLPGLFEALVRIEACGLCGTTDRHIVAGTQCFHPREAYPAVLGHEAVGRVVNAGDKVAKFRVGDLVTRPVAVWPGEPRDGLFSAWGGFAEYGIVRDGPALAESGAERWRHDYQTLRQNVVPEVTNPLDAVLAISLAEILSWTDRLGSVGGRAVVVGGTGFAGLAMCLFLKRAGASLVMALGRRDERLALALRAGADAGVNIIRENPADEGRRLTGGRGADVFCEATGADAVMRAGLACLKPGGVAAIYGAPDSRSYTFDMGAGPGEFSMRVFGAEEQLAYGRVIELIHSGLIATDLFRDRTWDGLESIHDALAAAERGEAVKGIVRIRAS